MKKIMTKSLSLFLAVVMVISCITVSKPNRVNADSTAYTIKVNLGTNCTTVYKNGKAIKAMICSPSNETPTGTFYVPVKYRWHEMIGNCYAQYCTRICDQILFHSVWYYKKGDKSTMSVAAYNVMGQKASHGCVRLLCKDSKWIYDHCAVGTKVVIFWGKKSDDPIKRPSFTPITNGKFTDWDPTDPDPKNPYKKKVPTVKANKAKIEFGTKVKLKNLVSAKDSAGNAIAKKKIKTKGKINTNKLGTYKVKYTVKDSLGNKVTKTFKFKVVDTKAPVISGAADNKDVAQGSKANVLTGVTAKSVPGKNLTSKIKVSVKYKNKKVSVKKGSVKFSNKGTYKITYSVKGRNKKEAKKTVKYTVKSHKVKLTLTASKVTLVQGTNAEFGYTYVKSLKTYDDKDLKIKKYVTYTGKVDMNKPGKYVITYKAQYKNQTYTAVIKKLTVTVKAKPATPEQPTTPETTTTAPETTTQAK